MSHSYEHSYQLYLFCVILSMTELNKINHRYISQYNTYDYSKYGV